MLQWDADSVALHFIDPGKPTQNAHFELLQWPHPRRANERSQVYHIFVARLPAKTVPDYNDIRPHSARGYLTPKEFADCHEGKHFSHLSVA